MEINNDYIIYQRGINCSLMPSSDTKCQSIRIRVSYNGKRIDLHTRIRVKPKYWNYKTQRVKRGFSYCEETDVTINTALNSYIRYVHLYFVECERNFREPVLTELRDKFNYMYKKTGKLKMSEFFYLFEEFIKIRSGEKGWGQDMVDVYLRLLEKIRKFRPDIKFTDWNVQTLETFKESLAQSMYNDAIKKNLSYLKSFIKWAKSKHYAVNEDFATYNPKLLTAQKQVRYLELDELEKIYNLNLADNEALDCTRDFFLFQCYTGLRYSDLKQLKRTNVYRDKRGKYFIRLLTEKDNDVINFQLAKRAVEIYNKYVVLSLPEGLLLPVLSNQKYNEHLKDLGKIAGLTGEWVDYEYRLQEKIEVRVPKCDLSSHTARRTFIVTALNEGVSTDLIMLITGHSDYNVMRPYIKANLKGTSSVIDALDKTYSKRKIQKASSKA